MPETGDRGIRLVREYLELMDDGRFDRAADRFAPDCEYFHPPTEGTWRVRGRDSIRSFLAGSRGSKPRNHVLERTIDTGEACAVVGRLESPDGDVIDYFVSFAQYDEEGITYYVTCVLGWDL